jgi:hypothetical protein
MEKVTFEPGEPVSTSEADPVAETDPPFRVMEEDPDTDQSRTMLVPEA